MAANQAEDIHQKSNNIDPWQELQEKSQEVKCIAGKMGNRSNMRSELRW